jgi:hypothetical protein
LPSALLTFVENSRGLRKDVLEETDESLYWMEILVEGKVMQGELLAPLMQEANQLIAILVSSLNTAKRDSCENRE